MEFINEVTSAPILVSFILISLWIFVKIMVDHWDIKYFQAGYHECLTLKQWYRLVYFPLCHSNWPHILLNITALWSLRFIEKMYSSIFILKYTIVLAIFEALSTIFVVHWVLKSSRLRFSPQHPIHNAAIYGFTSIVLGWLGFLSIDLAIKNKNMMFYVYGILPVPVPLAPIILMLLTQCILPRGHSLSHAGGLAGGYLLAAGFLKILPNSYWTVSFVVDFILILLYFVVHSQERSDTREMEEDVHEVIDYGLTISPPDNHSSNNSVAISRTSPETDLEQAPLLSWEEDRSHHGTSAENIV